ncbi:hypothetical protein [Microvirga sp. 2TAF3]|uniref:hypothetical protein n=1 Tax=Microvirga sp. 2TAF3 TaxID=3233014 RepID=UPI003F99A4A5
MPLSKLTKAISRLSPKKRRAEKAREELKANAEKALRMKQESDTGSHVPPHMTAREGMHAKPGATNAALARETNFTTQRGRSAGTRTGDT